MDYDFLDTAQPKQNVAKRAGFEVRQVKEFYGVATQERNLPPNAKHVSGREINLLDLASGIF